MKATLWATTVFLSLSASQVFAGDAEKKAELNTDRPDFTESSVTVPRGRLQMESGVTWSDEPGGSEVLSGPELLFRYGLFEKTELRFVPPDYLRVRGRGLILSVMLAVAMFPQISIVGPLYLVLRELHLLNTYPGLVLP